MKAIGRNIVIDIIEETIKTDSGILLSAEDAKGLRYGKGVVVTAGTDVQYINEGDTVESGQRIGMIKFGSQVDVVIPDLNQLKIQVKAGEEVQAGTTVLAEFKSIDEKW